jgi:hypothetical protein
MTKHQTCRLCCEEKELRESHIIPKFVSDWQKESSGTGFLRSSEMPNRRVQDGEKEYMLCSDCEALFNQWETPFATRIFHPLNRQEAIRFEYKSWLLKFAISVSWRVLSWYKSEDLSEISESGKSLIAKALQTWKEFLFDQRPHPGSFEQHMILLDVIKSIQNIDNLPPNWNRFMIRGYHINLAHSDGHPLYIYTKMGRITLLGFIGIKHPQHWLGTKIHVRRGVIGGSIRLPVQFLDYMRERALTELHEQDRISKKQYEVISRTYRKDRDRAVKSETFQALDHDVRLFGINAVFSKKDAPNKDST